MGKILYIVTTVCLVWITAVSCKRSFGVPNVKQTNKLYGRLLNDYNKDVRPASDQSQPLPVAFGPSLIEVLALDETSGHMILNLWLRMTWTDASLKWDPSDYNGLTKLHVPAKNLWLPDVVLFNGFDSQVNTDLDAIVGYDGSVLWVAPAIVKLTCRHEFRGNHWVCPLKFGSWTYSSAEMDLLPFGDADNKIETSFYMSADQWEVSDANGVKKNMFINGEEFPTMQYILRLRNKMLGRFGTG